MKRPRDLALDSSITMMILTVKIPAAPMPVIARPMIKVINDLDKAVSRVPSPSMMVDAKIEMRGVKTWLSFPLIGDVEDMAI